MDVAPEVDRRDFDAVDEAETVRVSRGPGLGQAGHRVVIGDAGAAEPGRPAASATSA